MRPDPDADRSRRRHTARTARTAGAAALALLALLVPASTAAAGDHHAQSHHDDAPVVTTDDGALQGRTGDAVTSFLGVPYAAPPVGDLRWAAPQPAQPWDGVRDATRFAGSCTQGDGWDPGYEQPTLNEDCLYLNVYRPASVDADAELPVFVWNHGGGNVGGAGRDSDPTRFVTRGDVVFVTINYRLGAMGWLDTPALEAANSDGSTGNFALLDQQAALRWVQGNIAAFGGDPDNVTLAGQSAGASNNVAQLASPGAAGLFDRAVLQSGGGTPARTLDAARTTGEGFAAQLGCPPGTDQVACLRAKSPADVLAAQTAVRVAGAVAGTPVLPTDPVALMKAGDLTDLPVIYGGTSDESQQSVFAEYDHQGDPITPEVLDQLVATTYPGGAEQVRAAYPAADYASPTVAWGDVQSDQRACRDQTTRERLAADTRAYVYEFAEQDGPPFASIWRLGTDYPFGATHVNDLGYLWDYLGTALPFSDAQEHLSDQMIDYWSSFARDGVPQAGDGPVWPAHQPGGDVLQLAAPGAGVVQSADLDAAHRCGLWNAVSPAP